jgi:ABC-type bacteriocin/lantibiotic exporter with double-glycine peptidase domain
LGSFKPSLCVPLISICPEGSINEGNFFIFVLTVVGVSIIIMIYYVLQILDVSCQKITNLCRRKENKDLNENKFRIDIGFQNLSVQLRDGRKILQNVCGEFKNGRLTAIMGLSGSGKT